MSAGPGAAADLDVDVLGARVAVSVPTEVVDSVRAQWSRCRSSRRDLPPDTVLDLRDECLDDVAPRLTRELTWIGIEHQRGHRLMLHAACVADPASGRGLALVGPSGMGKTTAATHLCRNGFGYVTDETVALDEDQVALLYPKPLSVVALDLPRRKLAWAPDTLGLAVADRQPTVTALVLLARTAAHDRPALERARLLDAVVELIPQTSALPDLDRPLTWLRNLVCATGGAMRLRYRDIATATDLLDQTVRSQPGITPGGTLHRPPSPEVGGQRDRGPVGNGRTGPTTGLSRGPHTEALEAEGEVLVLIGSVPVRLGGIGATIWLACDRPQSVAALIDRCVRAHGSTGDSALRVGAAVDELLAHGLLVPQPPAR